MLIIRTFSSKKRRNDTKWNKTIGTARMSTPEAAGEIDKGTRLGKELEKDWKAAIKKGGNRQNHGPILPVDVPRVLARSEGFTKHKFYHSKLGALRDRNLERLGLTKQMLEERSKQALNAIRAVKK